MYEPTPRERGVIVRPLNLESLLADINGTLESNQTASVPFTWALATAADGTQYLLCDEGVGYPVDTALEVYIDTDHGDGSSTVSMFADREVRLPDPGQYATDGIDLADFIRVFGTRLESNFWLWHRTLTRGGK